MAARETFRGCSSPGRRPKARESSPGSPASSVSQPRAAWSPPADATLRRKARKFAFPTRRTTTSTSAGSRAGITRVARRGILPAEIPSVPETPSSQDRLTYRACHLCEALCGIEIRSRGDEIVAVRGDAAGPLHPRPLRPQAAAPRPSGRTRGANPLASNGSIMSGPEGGKRLKAIRDRGGKVVVVDPCRTETADVAPPPLFTPPAPAAASLLALVTAFLERGPP